MNSPCLRCNEINHPSQREKQFQNRVKTRRALLQAYAVSDRRSKETACPACMWSPMLNPRLSPWHPLAARRVRLPWSEVNSSSRAILRSLIPALATIRASLVSTSLAISALVMICPGTQAPIPTLEHPWFDVQSIIWPTGRVIIVIKHDFCRCFCRSKEAREGHAGNEQFPP